MRISDWSADVCSSDLPPLLGVVTHAHHDQRIAQAGKTQAKTALGIGLALLLLQRPLGGNQDVIQHAYRQPGGPFHFLDIETRLVADWRRHVHGQVQTAQAAASVLGPGDRTRTRLHSSHYFATRLPSSASQPQPNHSTP